MTEFNSGDGWREIDITRKDAPPADRLLLNEFGKPMRGWVREAPVPPLPTEPYTVIGIGDWRLARLEPYEPGLPGAWEMLPIPKAVQSSIEDAGARMQCAYGDEWVRAEAEQHGGFEVLAEPPAVTAKAVLNRVRMHLPDVSPDGSIMSAIAREFGVES